MSVERGRPLGGDWLFTTRPGAEVDLIEELTLVLGPGHAALAGPSCVRARGAPTTPGGALDLTFARQGFRIERELGGEPRALIESMVDGVGKLPALGRQARGAWSFSVWTPDSDATLPLGPLAEHLEAAVLRRLSVEQPALAARHRSAEATGDRGVLLVQAALVARDRVVLGVVSGADALSLAPAGRARMRVSGARPSRSARKLEEALAWLGVAPSPGELCVDLGAAPGGWSWVLLERRARVIAVDPGRLRPDLLARAGLEYRGLDAFRFEPSEPADWLFCDMAWRPLEVAGLLAKWARRRWAALLVANLKLPMRRKADTVERLRGTVAAGGWQDVRTRQLYHDRDEVTLTAHR